MGPNDLPYDGLELPSVFPTTDVAAHFEPSTEQDFIDALGSVEWRLGSGRLYKILIKGDDEHDLATVLPFVPNDAQADLLTSMWHRTLILKARQLGFCLTGKSRVLTADLQWVRVDEIQPGTEIVAVDEHIPGGRGAARQMKTGTVRAVLCRKAQAFRITFDDGREVECTDRHPWLSRKVSTETKWRSISGTGNEVTGKLRVGTKVRWVAKPWEASTFEDGWFGGIIDGEGSMAKARTSGAEINVAQREGAVWDRMVAYARDRGYSARIEGDAADRPFKHGRQAVPKLCFSRMDELFRLVGQCRPTRFVGRRFWDGKSLPGKRTGEGWATITSIEPIGEQVVYDLQTSTGTYIAEGFVSHNTTAIAICWTDHAMFTKNQRVGIIAHHQDVAAEILRDKVLFAYENLPDDLQRVMPLKRQTQKELLWGHNNSSIRVATSMRGGTIHRLHISEFGKIAAVFPMKAMEIITGSLPAVPQSQIAVIESTAEGLEGEFYKLATKAQALHETLQADPRPMSRTEWAFRFYPWFTDINYRTDPTHVFISPADHAYFAKIERQMSVKLDLQQRAFYVSKRDNDFSGDGEKMWREYPSTPDECWQKSTEGTWYAQQLAAARISGRIGVVPHIANIRVNTFWDIGAGDGTAIWLHQYVGSQHRLIGFIEGWGEGYDYYVRELRETGYVFGGMFLPHDAMQERQLMFKVGKPLDMLQELAPDWDFHIVPRVDTLSHGITMTKMMFPQFYFDAEGCKAGIAHLQQYKKKWISNLAVWSTEEHDHNSPHTEAADALRQLAQGFDPAILNMQQRPSRRSTRNLGAGVL